jgi:hypothetical protein
MGDLFYQSPYVMESSKWAILFATPTLEEIGIMFATPTLE